MAEYLALPKQEGRHPAVVVIHEWWGLNDQMKALADRWTAEGFIAVVPDLYDGKVVPIGKSDEAATMMNKLDFPGAVKKIAAAVELVRSHPRCNGKVVVTGYCMGGALSFATSQQVSGLAAVVPFYGLPGTANWDKVDAPIQAHFASHDTWATVAGATEIKSTLDKLGKPMELHVYDAQHAFCNDQRPDVYNAEAAQQAWQRAVAFARSHTA
jgi:carboxymethylenebutenolidase